MNQGSLESELQKTKRVLGDISEILSDMRELIDKVALTSDSSNIPEITELQDGESNLIICSTPEVLESNVFHQYIADLPKQNIPTLVKLASPEVYDYSKKVSRIIHQKIKALGKPCFVLILRMMHFIKPIRIANTVVFGVRYYRDDTGVFNRIHNSSISERMKIIRDEFQYGGGLLAFTVIADLDQVPDVCVYEVFVDKDMMMSSGNLRELLLSISSSMVMSSG